MRFPRRLAIVPLINFDFVDAVDDLAHRLNLLFDARWSDSFDCQRNASAC
ncbi:MAG: hypothetical protein ABFS02_11025 [Pseudomonadota bacterium]